MKKYLELEDISAYRISFELANYIWNIVMKWDYFTKDTIGKQLVRAIDSISANIAEGFGRYFKKDKVNFYHYSYGSISESLDWVKKAKIRNLLKDEDEEYIISVLDKLPKEISNLINFTNKKLKI
ncbi:MAG: four helix bundle protein [Candidatus Omnitrophica bacterium]|nr:four helix bundle protein [Candidatus Omnitrophota bacterium]